MSASPECPSLVDLFDPAGLPTVEQHVTRCPRCQSFRREHHFQGARTSGATAAEQWLTPAQPISIWPGSLDLGTVLSAVVDHLDEYLVCVVVDADEQEAVVAPIAETQAYTTNWDLMIEEAVLGYPAMAEVWNTGTILVEQAAEIVGKLTEPLAEALEQLYDAMLENHSPPEHLPIGSPVLAERDPRLVFQRQELDRVRAYWMPSSLLAGAESFEPILRRRAQQMGVGLEDLDGRLQDCVQDNPHWVTSLSRGDIDLCASVPVKAMSRLVIELKLPKARKTIGLIGATVHANCREASAPQAAVHARRRRGKVRASKPTEDDRGKAAESYMEALVRDWDI